MSFTLSADTSCDILRNEMTARGIEYRPLVYTIDDVPHFDEFAKDEDYKGFYDQIRAGKMPTTSQINIVEHEEFFETLLDKYEGDIVHVTLSSGLSSTYASACKAAENVNEKHGNRVYVVDSLGATIATRHVVDEAQRVRGGRGGTTQTVYVQTPNLVYAYRPYALKAGRQSVGPVGVYRNRAQHKTYNQLRQVRRACGRSKKDGRGQGHCRHGRSV